MLIIWMKYHAGMGSYYFAICQQKILIKLCKERLSSQISTLIFEKNGAVTEGKNPQVDVRDGERN